MQLCSLKELKKSFILHIPLFFTKALHLEKTIFFNFVLCTHHL